LEIARERVEIGGSAVVRETKYQIELQLDVMEPEATPNCRISMKHRALAAGRSSKRVLCRV
jgi:hypothetical protein